MGSAKERIHWAERDLQRKKVVPPRSPARGARRGPALKGNRAAHVAQFGWYRGLFRPIVDGEAFFFCRFTLTRRRF